MIGIRALLICLASALSACTSLPDVQPFADASNALAASVKESGTAVAESLATGSVPETPRKDFDTAWVVRVNSALAMAEYSNQIVSLAAAGQSGRESAGKVADGISKLFGTAISGGLAIGVDAAKFVYGEVAKIRALESLEEATTRAQPFVEMFAKALSTDLRTLTVLLERAELNRKDHALNNSDGVKDWHDRYQRVARQIRSDALDPSKSGPARSAALKDGAELAILFADVRANYLAFESSEKAAAKTHALRLKLIAELGLSIEAWEKSHRNLGDTLRRSKGTVDVAQLKASLSDVQSLIKRIQAL